VKGFSFPYQLLLLAIWSSVLAAGNYVVVETSARQIRATRFASTTGEITRSDLGRGAIRHRGIDIAYSYSVNRVGYMGSQYRYDERNGSLDYKEITNSFLAGSKQTVYYDAANPANAVLSPGLNGCDLLLMLFAIPLDIITIALWVTTIRHKCGFDLSAPAGGVRILQRAGETRARLATFSPLAVGFFGLAGAAFAGAILVVSTSGFAPSLRFMSAALILVSSAGVGMYWWTARRHRSGLYDLRITDGGEIVILPPVGERNKPLLISKGEIVAVSMHRRVSHNPSGQHFSYVPALEHAAQNTQPTSLHLVDLGWDEAKARSFSAWLSRQLGVRFTAMY